MKRNILLTVAAAALALAPASFGDDATLGVTVGPEASFVSHDATTTLSKIDTTFGAISGTTHFTYKIRTSQTTGTGSVTVLVTAFTAGTGGATVPLVSDLAYTCTASSPGTACSSSTAASTTVASPVVTFLADAHSAEAGDAATAIWSLVDKVAVQTGTYSSVATFTVSAT
jgi:hypothetical protein